VFHASLLSPYQETTAHGPNFLRPPPDLIDGEEEFEVERIISHRRHGRSRTLQYLVKWKGYPESNNTWEPAAQIHAPDLLQAYHRKRPLEHIKAVLMQRSKPIPSYWIPPLPTLQASLTSSVSTGTSLVHALVNHNPPSTTRTRNSSVPTSQRRIKNSSTVLVFPCHPCHLGPPRPLNTTSVQVAIVPHSAPTPPPSTPRTTLLESCPTHQPTCPSSPPWKTLPHGTTPPPYQSLHHSLKPPYAPSRSPPRSLCYDP
jgi:hypothetical protein